MLIIGIKPNFDSHGFALYRDLKLVYLNNWRLLDIQAFIKSQKVNGVNMTFVVEDARRLRYSDDKEIQSVQAQFELIRLFEHEQVPFIVDRNKTDFAKQEQTFRFITHWRSKSNELTRAAAYAGYIQVNKVRECNALLEPL